jgi:hypothetical protein
MNIAVAQHLKLFSHLPGSSCLIPGSVWQVQAFPTRFVLTSPAGAKHIISLSLKGSVRDFTLLQDLERNSVSIFGTSQEGFFFWQIDVVNHALWLRLQRTPDTGCDVAVDGKAYHLGRKEVLRIASVDETVPALVFERLSFGSHKKQEWEGMRRRLDMREILPIWLRLGQLTPPTATAIAIEERGTMGLLRHCQNLATHENKEKLPEALDRLFLAGFRSMFLPSLTDDWHQGLLDSEENISDSHASLQLLREGAVIIRRLFFHEENHDYALLPALPSPWHCGRFIGLRSSCGDRLDLEWSKKMIRRVEWHPAITRQTIISLPHTMKAFRVRNSLQSKGWRQKSDSLLSLEAGVSLYLDRFEK